MSPNIYVLITCSLIERNWEERFQECMIGVQQTINVFKNIPNVKVMIVENTGKRESFLDSFKIPVLYTNTNNEINTKNKGIKELTDIWKAIDHFQMTDHDFLIKVNARYFIHDDSPFVKIIQNFSSKSYDSVLRYGGFNLNQVFKEKYYSCITGLVGMTVKYIKQIELPEEDICLEWKWAEVSNRLSDDNICILDYLGLTQYINDHSYVVLS